MVVFIYNLFNADLEHQTEKNICQFESFRVQYHINSTLFFFGALLFGLLNLSHFEQGHRNVASRMFLTLQPVQTVKVDWTKEDTFKHYQCLNILKELYTSLFEQSHTGISDDEYFTSAILSTSTGHIHNPVSSQGSYLDRYAFTVIASPCWKKRIKE